MKRMIFSHLSSYSSSGSENNDRDKNNSPIYYLFNKGGVKGSNTSNFPLHPHQQCLSAAPQKKVSFGDIRVFEGSSSEELETIVATVEQSHPKEICRSKRKVLAKMPDTFIGQILNEKSKNTHEFYDDPYALIKNKIQEYFKRSGENIFIKCCHKNSTLNLLLIKPYSDSLSRASANFVCDEIDDFFENNSLNLFKQSKDVIKKTLHEKIIGIVQSIADIFNEGRRIDPQYQAPTSCQDALCRKYAKFYASQIKKNDEPMTELITNTILDNLPASPSVAIALLEDFFGVYQTQPSNRNR